MLYIPYETCTKVRCGTAVSWLRVACVISRGARVRDSRRGYALLFAGDTLQVRRRRGAKAWASPKLCGR